MLQRLTLCPTLGRRLEFDTLRFAPNVGVQLPPDTVGRNDSLDFGFSKPNIVFVIRLEYISTLTFPPPTKAIGLRNPCLHKDKVIIHNHYANITVRPAAFYPAKIRFQDLYVESNNFSIGSRQRILNSKLIDQPRRIAIVHGHRDSCATYAIGKQRRTNFLRPVLI